MGIGFFTLVLVLTSLACTAKTDNFYSIADNADTETDSGMPGLEALRGIGGDIPNGGSGGWSANGTLITGNDSKQARLQALFAKIQVFTVQFNLVRLAPAPVAPVDLPIRCEALITWSVEGNQVTRRVSVGDGVSITGIGQNVTVVVSDTTDRTLHADALGATYNVSINVAPGSRASVQQPATLQPDPKLPGNLYVILAGQSKTIPIQEDAGVISTFVTVFGGAAGPQPGMSVVQFQCGGFTVGQYDPTKETSWVPVPAGCKAIVLTNFSIEDYAFTVTYGIDG